MTTKTNIEKQGPAIITESEEELNFRVHSALIIQVKERIRELELVLENDHLLGFKMRKEVLEAKAHNQKILVGLMFNTLEMEPPTKSIH